MKCLLILALLLFHSAFTQHSELLEQFSARYTAFAADVYKGVMKSNSGNFIVCPLSVDIVLALAESGSEGQTAKELAATLRLPSNREETHQIFRVVLPNLQSTNEYILSTANKIYVQDGYELRNQFKTVALDVFDAELENIEFSENEKAADVINRWVENKTNDKIKNLIDPAMLDSTTRTVLVNAMYFHGKWFVAFNSRNTDVNYFYKNSRDRVSINMMSETTSYEYYESPELNAKFLKLNYKGGDVSLHIVLPNDIEGLAALEKNISVVLNPPMYTFTEVSVTIPKFKMETEIKFLPILEEMGIKEAFSDDANFQEFLIGNVPFKISEVIQKAVIEVDEEGTVAAAATAAIGSMLYSRESPRQFYADHPFLFYLRLNKLGVNLFIGRFTAPTEEVSCLLSINCIFKEMSHLFLNTLGIDKSIIRK